MSTKAKFILTYVGGIVTGVIFVFAFFAFMNKVKYEDPVDAIDRNVEMYDKPQQKIEANVLKVFQVLPDGSALAKVDYYDEPMDTSLVDHNKNYGLVVMFLSYENSSYFDDQKINVPSGKCLRQVGTYTYESRLGVKTVPVVEIMEK